MDPGGDIFEIVEGVVDIGGFGQSAPVLLADLSRSEASHRRIVGDPLGDAAGAVIGGAAAELVIDFEGVGAQIFFDEIAHRSCRMGVDAAEFDGFAGSMAGQVMNEAEAGEEAIVFREVALQRIVGLEIGAGFMVGDPPIAKDLDAFRREAEWRIMGCIFR